MTIRIDPSKTTRVNPSIQAKLYPTYNPYDGYYVDLTVDKTEVGDAVLDFPLCVQGNEMPAGFWSHVNDGTDIIVVDPRSGRRLHKEVELLDKAGGSEKLALHTKIPLIGTARDEVVRLYYGGAGVLVDTDFAVWDQYYSFVSHMADYNAGTQIWDSTKNRNHGTKGAGAAAPTEVAGTVGRAQQFVKVSTQFITLPANILGGQSVASVTALYNVTSFDASYQTLYEWGISDSWQGHFLSVQRDGTSNRWVYILADGVNYDNPASGSNTPIGSWATTSLVLETSRLVGYQNGSQVAVDNALATARPLRNDGTAHRLGSPHNQATTSRYYNGLIDELRLSSVARSAEWIALEYKTLLTPTTLYGISAESSV